MPFEKSKITLTETGQFSNFFLDYISKSNLLRGFYAYEPSIEVFDKVIEDKVKENINRLLLVTVINEQYAKIKNCELQKKNTALLLNNNTFTVATGHQLCLFTGPLYFIFKIITTINLSESLKIRYPQYNFVPIYVMASEDHDFEEINKVNLFGKKIIWDNKNTESFKGNTGDLKFNETANNIVGKGPVGKLNTESIKFLIDELSEILGESENALELIQLYKESYLNNENLADATRHLVHHLFSQYGLVIMDSNDKRLKNEFSDIIKDDIINHSNYKIVKQTIHNLEQIGVKAQANPREINCFYMIDNLRERIEYNNISNPQNTGEGVFKVLNTAITFTSEELIEEINNYPERFSPNVILRPVYQQKILPNIAYVGGPGEIAYWLEYKNMFDFHNINFPVLIPRNFALLTNKKIELQLQKLGFTFPDLFKNMDVLIKEFVINNASSDLSFKEQEINIIKIYSDIAAKVSAVDITLKSSVEAELQKALNAIKNIENKLTRAEKQKQAANILQITKLKDKFFPEGALQERYENMTPYYLMHGKKWIADLKEHFNPFDFNLLILTEQKD